MERIRGWAQSNLGTEACVSPVPQKRLTRRAWEQLRDLEIRRGVDGRQAVVAFPLHSMGVAWDLGKERLGHKV